MALAETFHRIDGTAVPRHIPATGTQGHAQQQSLAGPNRERLTVGFILILEEACYG
jgi:hypothetical protein